MGLIAWFVGSETEYLLSTLKGSLSKYSFNLLSILMHLVHSKTALVLLFSAFFQKIHSSFHKLYLRIMDTKSFPVLNSTFSYAIASRLRIILLGLYLSFYTKRMLPMDLFEEYDEQKS